MFFSGPFFSSWFQFVPIFLVLLIAKYYFHKRRLFKLGSRLPGPRPWIIIGNALDFLEKDIDYLSKMTELNKKYGLTAHWIGHQLYVYICTPEDAEIFYKSKHLLDKPPALGPLKSILGEGLLTSNGNHWVKGKKWLGPPFNYSSLQNFTHVLHERGDILLQSLRKEEGKNSFSIYKYIRDCAFDIVCEIALSPNLNCQGGNVDIIDVADFLMTAIVGRVFSLWEQFDFVYKLTKKGKNYFQKEYEVKKFVDSEIEKRKILYDSKNTKTGEENINGTFNEKALIYHLFKDEAHMDNNELRDHMLTTIVAGYETTALAICFALIMLGMHQDVQDRLYDELVNGNEGSEYLEMVIKETLRLFPSVPISFRQPDQDIQMRDHLIPKEAQIAINIFAIHRNPKEYENPEVFNPDNFLPENVKARHQCSFLPFGMGSRMCFGSKFAMMVTRAIVSKIVRDYKIECDLKMEDIKLKYQITLKIKDYHYPLRLIRR